MRILYFTRDYTTHDRRFLERLAASPHEVGFLRLEDDGVEYEQRSVPAGIHSLHWRGGSRPHSTMQEQLALLPDLRQVIQAWRPDVVHAGPIPSCGYLAALAGARPLLVMSWGSDLLVDADRDEESRTAVQFTLRFADRLLCDCDAVRRKANEFATFPPERVVQFPWGVDLKAFAPAGDRSAARARLGLRDEFVVLSTRRWEDLYGIDTVLEAVGLARQRIADRTLRLVLLGDGSQAARVRGFLAAQGLEAVVDTPGLVSHDRLPGYFQAADLYISCAKSDGASISLLEAMASGLPVVVTDSASNREWVDGPPSGWLAPTGNADAFARGIAHFSALSAEERQAAGAANRVVAASRADWSTNVNLLLAAYEDMHRARQQALAAERA